jgi:hypothetical protein
MAIKELFQDSRPQVLFDPRASQRIDPRFKFTRAGTASYYDSDGVLRVNGAPANQPRVGFSYEPDANGVMRPAGLLLESAVTNLTRRSQDFTSGWTSSPPLNTVSGDVTTAPDGTTTADLISETANTSSFYANRGDASVVSGTTYTFSVFLKKGPGATAPDWVNLGFNLIGFGITITASFNLNSGSLGQKTNAISHGITKLPNGWYRCHITAVSNQTTNNSSGVIGFTNNQNTPGYPGYAGQITSNVYAWGAQVEASYSPTSYIPTVASTVTRAADLLSIDTDIPSTGSLYIDAQALDTSINTTLLSAANAANDKLLLQVQQPASLYGSTGLVYSVDGAFKPTLPFPVPGTTRERNLITWGANNNHYRSDSSRKTASSSTSVPADMTELGIGHDVTDPTKGFTGYINTVYMWPGEITPTVAEALVRNAINLKDADVADPVPADTLAFVFNTQGTTTSGDTQVILPLRGSTNNVLVDWGDDTSSALVGAAASVNVTKTYNAPGIYSVQLTANADGANEALQNLDFFGNNPTKLFRVQKWGGTAVFRPTTMFRVFRDCTQLDFEDAARTELPDTSAITNWQEAFYNCNKISGTFPTFNTTAATTFQSTWFGCSSMTAFPFIESASVTNFNDAWRGCSSLVSFPSTNTAAGTNFQQAWENCTSLTAFPLINTAAGTNFGGAWSGCSSLTSFPLINTAAGTNFFAAWQSCSSLTSFPLINTAAGTNFQQAWQNCSSLTSFPLINTAAGTNFRQAWTGCTSLTSFPLIDTSACTNFIETWRNCSSLTNFPLINTAAGTNFIGAWFGCTSLTSFPLIDTSSGTDFGAAWFGCTSLTSFPLINTSAVTNFRQAWNGCTSLTSFPALDFDAAAGLASAGGNIGFLAAWQNCTSLADFPANLFDNTTSTWYFSAFANCALTAQSIENILVSINTANTSNGNLTLSGGTNANTSTWSTAANNAYIALVSRGWTITQNGTAPS